MLIFINILAFVVWALGTAVLLRPFLGGWAVLVALPILVYPLYAWLYADKLVAAQAGFRKPTGLQERYFEFLELEETVLTHPSLSVAAGVLAGPRGKTFLVTAGLTRYLNDPEIKNLIAGLGRREHYALFNWTYHMAAGGTMLFLTAPTHDVAAQWFRLVFVSSIVIISLTTSMLAIYINALSGVIPAWLAVAALLVPFLGLVVWTAWCSAVMSLSKRAAKRWNDPIWVSDIVLRPMRLLDGRGHALHLLSPGLVEALDVPEDRPEPGDTGHQLVKDWATWEPAP